MNKLVIGLAAFVLLAAGGAMAGGALTDSSNDNGITTGTNVSATLGTTLDDVTTGRTDTVEDVRGPCDEAEHANDPRCIGATPAAEDDDRVADDHNRGAVDDDDHADDRSGPNRGHDGGDDHGGDRSGSGSGSDD